MRLGFLSACLGIASDDPKLPELLRRAARSFVRAGGSVTLTEWAGLSDEERAALIDARESIEERPETIEDALERAVTP